MKSSYIIGHKKETGLLIIKIGRLDINKWVLGLSHLKNKSKRTLTFFSSSHS